MSKDKTPAELKKEQITKEVEAKLAEEDLNKRLKEFSKEFFPLLKKYKIGLGAEPRFATMGEKGTSGGFVTTAIPVWFDDTKRIDEMSKNGGAEKQVEIVEA